MNILAIDAGNSRVKWGYADDGGWVRRGWLATAEAATLAQHFAELTSPARVVISNVAGETVRAALTAAVTPFALPPLWVQGRARQCGVRSGYADPAQLGADRWAALIAAWKLFHTACLVVNAGTTVTIDALADEDADGGEGVFLGGCIVPGTDLMRHALARGTAQLALRDGAFYYFPDNTADAIMSGATNAVIGAIERMCNYMQESGQGTPLVVISGGAAPTLRPRLHLRTEFVDNLVLEGLLEIGREEM